MLRVAAHYDTTWPIAETRQFLARLARAPSGRRVQQYDRLVRRLVRAGVWARLDALHLMVAENYDGALRVNEDATPGAVNMIHDSTLLAAVGGDNVTSTTGHAKFWDNQGCFLDGNAQLLTPDNMATMAGSSAFNFKQNDACAFGWHVGNYQTIGVSVGQGEGTTFTYIYPLYVDGNYYFRLNSTVDISGAFAHSSTNDSGPHGFWSLHRTDASTVRIDRNGTQWLLSSNSSSAPSSVKLKYGGDGASDLLTGGILVGGYGASLTQDQSAELYAALTQYMDDVRGYKYASSYQARQFINRISTFRTDYDVWRTYATMIDGLVADGAWDQLDALYMMVGEETRCSTENLVQNRFYLRPVSPGTPPTFTAFGGFDGGGGRLFKTKYDPTLTNIRASQNDNCLFVHNPTGTTMNNTGAIGNANTHELFFGSDTHFYWGLSNPGSDDDLGAGQTAPGLWHALRDGSTSGRVFKNGSSAFSGTVTTSTTPPNTEFSVLGNLNTTWSQKQYAAGIGRSMTNAQCAALYSRINTALIALGAP